MKTLPTDDPRQPLLHAITAYAARFPDEAAVCQRITAFVSEHPDCFHRELLIGHVTGSAWVVDPSRTRVLLTHHRKLQRWVQLGGHCDGDPDVPGVATREAFEESGIESIAPAEPFADGIFDIDIHEIPARSDVPTHLHYDVRYALVAGSEDFVISEESLDLAWVPVAEMETYSQRESMLRMTRKWLAATGAA